jgi:hypothetical protein
MGYILAVLCLAGIVAGQRNGSLRLADGSLASQGRVEIYKNNEWGTICDDSWSIVDGGVACRELGYINATMVANGAFYGEGSGPIHLQGVECTGNETNITDCPVSAIKRRCDHGDDAGVICWPPRKLDDGLSSSVIAIIVLIPFLLIIIGIFAVIMIMLYMTLTYDKDAKEKKEKEYQERRFLKGIKLKDKNNRSLRSRRKSDDTYVTYVSERNIPRGALGEGRAHPWQDYYDNSDIAIDEDLFDMDGEEDGEVRQRIVSAINPTVMAEVETQENEDKDAIPARYKKQAISTSNADQLIDTEFGFAYDDNESDVNPYEQINIEDD